MKTKILLAILNICYDADPECKIESAKNSHLITRVKHAEPLRLMDGDRVLMHYIDKMVYWKNLFKKGK